MPPGRGDIPTFSPAKDGTRFNDPDGCRQGCRHLHWGYLEQIKSPLPPSPLEVGPLIAARRSGGAVKLPQRVRAEPGRQTYFGGKGRGKGWKVKGRKGREQRRGLLVKGGEERQGRGRGWKGRGWDGGGGKDKGGRGKGCLLLNGGLATPLATICPQCKVHVCDSVSVKKPSGCFAGFWEPSE